MVIEDKKNADDEVAPPAEFSTNNVLLQTGHQKRIKFETRGSSLPRTTNNGGHQLYVLIIWVYRDDGLGRWPILQQTSSRSTSRCIHLRDSAHTVRLYLPQVASYANNKPSSPDLHATAPLATIQNLPHRLTTTPNPLQTPITI